MGDRGALPDDPRLAALTALWPRLGAADRAALLALAEYLAGNGDRGGNLPEG